MENLKAKAMSLGATEFGRSNVIGKRFYVIYNNNKINFCSATGKTFIDHKDKKIRDAWKARHMKIKNKAGQLVYKLRTSPSFWSMTLLWT